MIIIRVVSKLYRDAFMRVAVTLFLFFCQTTTSRYTTNYFSWLITSVFTIVVR